MWKEFREQGVIGLTLIVLGTGILIAAATLAEPPTQGATPADVVRFLGAGLLATIMLAVTAGTVCGGALFAAEREAGTLGFLESLPASRWSIWRSKLTAGLLLAVAQIALVLLVATSLGLVTSLGWAFAIAMMALLAFAWGMYGSTYAQTTLGSVGVAVPTGSAAFIFFFIPLWMIFPNPRTNMLQPEGGLLFLGLMFVTPLLGSLIRFTQNDRERSAHDTTPVRRVVPKAAPDPEETNEPDPYEPRRAKIGLRALLWLSTRQLAKAGLIIALFAIVMALGLLPDNIQPIMMWPGLALAAGVLAGVTMFMDEQSSGSAKFWGERRLPIGRLWLVKLVVHGAFAVALAFLLLLPAAIRAEAGGAQLFRGGSFLASALRSLLFNEHHLGLQGWKFLALPLVYGFAAGHLSGLLFKKAVVAAGVAGVVGGSLATFWFPSLFAGGTKHWQLWAAPALALLTARLLLRAWSSERLFTRRPIRTLAGGLVAILLVQGVGILWRVLEVPDRPGSEDDEAYIATLPSLEVNDSGRQFRTAAERFTRVAQSVPAARTGNSQTANAEDVVLNVPFSGWRKENTPIEEWLRSVYELDEATPPVDERWFVMAAAASREPADGIFEHPLRTGTTSSLQTQLNGRRMGMIMLAHGLKEQAAGNLAAFPDDLRTALALSRTYRNGSITSSLGFGVDVARAACSAGDHWVAAYSGPTDHLKHMLGVLKRDEAAPPIDPQRHLMAERYILRDQAKAPGQFLPPLITPPGKDREQVSAVVDLIGVAWNTPWERERTRRLLGLGFESGLVDDHARALVRGRPGAGIFNGRKLSPREMIDQDRVLHLHRRSLMLMAALRLHAIERGTVPRSLNELVALGYLESVPMDPFSDEPFRYRISAGELLVPPPSMISGTGSATPPGARPREIKPGQALFWSVGPDGVDDGGRTTPVRPGAARPGPDLVYEAPLPSRP